MLKPTSINLIKNLAIKLEATDMAAAHALMEMAHSARPNGLYIKQKLHQYMQAIQAQKDHIQNLATLQRTGELAIIPIGFRCFTAKHLKHNVGISQQTLPFDVGFFPPASVASILTCPQVSLCLQISGSFDICQKHENHNHPIHGNGIKFCRSSKEEVDKAVARKSKDKLNQYLDRTFGYYTLDNQHRYVLAHYNWHILADQDKSGGCTDMAANLKRASGTLNRRIARMINLCNTAKAAIFVFHNPQNYKYMLIDDKMLDLGDLSEVKEAATAAFKVKVHVVTDKELIESESLREQVAHASL